MNAKIEVELQESMGSDISIANAAWSSTYDKAKREDKYDDAAKVEELVKRLAKDGHSVPFESVVLRFWIRMDIITDRQHMTHRIASHNGLSGRYRTMPEDWISVPQDVKEILDLLGAGAGEKVADQYDNICTLAQESYRGWLKLLKEGELSGLITNAQFKRARERLRGPLPIAGMIERTTMMNLRSFANYQRLRNSAHAAPEIKEVARLMLEQVEAAGIAPVAIAALKANGWNI